MEGPGDSASAGAAAAATAAAAADALRRRGLVVALQQPALSSSSGPAQRAPAPQLVVSRPRAARDDAPEELRLEGCGLEECPLIEGERRLTFLSLRRNRLAAAPELCAAVARTLTVLDLSRNAISDLSELAAHALPQLRALLLSRNAIADLSPLQALPRLQLLDVAHNSLTSLQPLCALPALQVLRAAHDPLQALPCLTGLTGLTELCLEGCPLTDLTAATDAAAGGEPAAALPASLRRLSLRCGALGGAAAAAPLAALTGLEHLHLEGNPFTLAEALGPGESYRAVALATCCPLGLLSLDGVAVSPEERVLLLHAARRHAHGAAARGQLQSAEWAVEGAALALLQAAAAGQAAVAAAAGGNGGSDAAATARQAADGASSEYESSSALAGGASAASFLFATPALRPLPLLGAGGAAASDGDASAALPTPHLGSACSLPTHAASDSSGEQQAAGGDAQRAAAEWHSSVLPEAECGAPAEAGTDRLELQPVAEWWRARRWVAQGGEAPSAAAGELGSTQQQMAAGCDTGGVFVHGSPSPAEQRRGAGGDAAAAADFWSAASPSPQPFGGCPPISQQELEAEYLQAEGILLGSRDFSRARRAPERAATPGIEFDGRCLALTGGVLQALRAPSYAAVTEVRLSHVAFAPHIVNALPSLEALPRLTRLGLYHNRIATLPALDCLLRLARLRALNVSGSPVAGSALLRPYVAYRFPRLAALNDQALTQQEAATGAALFGALDCELARGLATPGQRAALAAAGLPAPPPAAEQEQQQAVSGGGEAGGSGSGGIAGALLSAAAAQGGWWQQGATAAAEQGPAAAAPPGWLPRVLVLMSGVAALAAACEGSGRAAAAGAAFAAAWAAEAGAVQSCLDDLDEGWGPLLVERCVEEGWAGSYTLPAT